jgi:hypothetical protein
MYRGTLIDELIHTVERAEEHVHQMELEAQLADMDSATVYELPQRETAIHEPMHGVA